MQPPEQATIDGILDRLPNANIERGRKLFYSQSGSTACASCHRIAGKGNNLAPDLSGIGVRSDLKTIVQAILDPNATITPGYERQVFETQDGQVIAGAVLGSGTSLMSMSGYPHPTVTEPSDGLVPEPDRVLGVVTLLGCPYVEVTAQLAPWLGLEFRLGYALHVAVYEFGDLIGLTRSALVLSGPMISGGVSIGVPGT